MKKSLFIFYLLLTSFFFTNALANTLADDDTGKDHPHPIPLYGNVSLISTVKYDYGKAHMVIKAVYPQLINDEPSMSVDDNSPDEAMDNDRQTDSPIENLNQLILNEVQMQIQVFRQQVTANRDAQQQLPRSLIKNNFNIDYDTSVIQVNHNHLISIRFSLQSFMGGMAHPYHYHSVLNYDINNDEQIELSDLFEPDSNYLDFLSAYTRSVLSTRLPDKQLIMQGTAPVPANFKTWNIKSKGLLITFDQGQVAPYVNGAEMVLIPYAAMKDITSPTSPIAACVKNPKRCAHTNASTGGFIDEAINTRHRRFNPSFG